MGPHSNCHWRRIPFERIGKSPTGSGYFALEYWGDHFGTPPTSYFMVAKSRNDFKVDTKDAAVKFGCFGFKED